MAVYFVCWNKGTTVWAFDLHILTDHFVVLDGLYWYILAAFRTGESGLLVSYLYLLCLAWWWLWDWSWWLWYCFGVASAPMSSIHFLLYHSLARLAIDWRCLILAWLYPHIDQISINLYYASSSRINLTIYSVILTMRDKLRMMIIWKRCMEFLLHDRCNYNWLYAGVGERRGQVHIAHAQPHAVSQSLHSGSSKTILPISRRSTSASTHKKYGASSKASTMKTQNYVPQPPSSSSICCSTIPESSKCLLSCMAMTMYPTIAKYSSLHAVHNRRFGAISAARVQS